MTNTKLATMLTALALLMSGAVAGVGDKPASSPAADVKGAKKETEAVKPTQPIDINSASKEQLKTIPGITDAEADKIIAGRPYLTKAHLVTHNILPMTQYVQIKDLIMARQK